MTIYGQSAGAGSVELQVIANNGKTYPPLFKGVIASSPYSPAIYACDDYVVNVRLSLANLSSLIIPERIYDNFVLQAGCANASNTLSCLRSTAYEDLVKANYYMTTHVVPGQIAMFSCRFLVTDSPPESMSSNLSWMVNVRLLIIVVC